MITTEHKRTYVILAAGEGKRMGRVGESLHKVLTPLDGQAILSHLLMLRPPQAKIVICLGYRADQIRQYMQLAHPDVKVTYVDVEGWNRPGYGGPGRSLLAAIPHVDGDLYFTSCDTLTERFKIMKLWDWEHSWMGVAPIPIGTEHERWCRVDVDSEQHVARILDKRPGKADWAYTGLGYIKRDDLHPFAEGITTCSTIHSELQITGGFDALLARGDTLLAKHMPWIDIGDEEAYRRAVARISGYDWTKTSEATYILPYVQRVVKFWANSHCARRRFNRGALLGKAVPELLTVAGPMMAYRYTPGTTAYDTAEHEGAWGTMRLLKWREQYLMQPVSVDLPTARLSARAFYQNKTYARVAMLSHDLRLQARDAINRIDWVTLSKGVQPGVFHGDFNYGNIICTGNSFTGIDWREDFGGQIAWGDLRYDLAKLLAGTYVHWDNARRGDFRPWARGAEHARVIQQDSSYTHEVEILGALSLLNSAPLHAAPLDEILVARACAWLEECL